MTTPPAYTPRQTGKNWPTQPPREFVWWNPGTWTRGGRITVVVGVLAFVALLAATIAGRAENEEPATLRTPVEAACRMLEEGDDPQFVYDVMKDLLADESFAVGEDEATAARLAVDRAIADGC